MIIAILTGLVLLSQPEPYLGVALLAIAVPSACLTEFLAKVEKSPLPVRLAAGASVCCGLGVGVVTVVVLTLYYLAILALFAIVFGLIAAALSGD